MSKAYIVVAEHPYAEGGIAAIQGAYSNKERAYSKALEVCAVALGENHYVLTVGRVVEMEFAHE